MIILNKPYVSDFLVETIKKNGFKVLDNEVARQFLSIDELTSETCAKNMKNELFYSNSENSIDWVIENFENEDIERFIQISKNKVLFREVLKEVYPDFYFKKVKFEDIKKLDIKELKFPFILKPSVGFLSFGVYPVRSEQDWQDVLLRLEADIEKFQGFFPENVVNANEFIIEEMIDGNEYAIDAYYNESGEAVILNIFQHPFFNDKDVSDRAYYTSKAIMEKYLDKFTSLLNEIGKVIGFKNYPFHLELRANDEKIIPIEINPMRFCGWCITDIAQNAWGINVYEYYFKNLKPNWSEILKNSTDDYFYFTIGDIPQDIDRKDIKEIDFKKYLKNISNPLVVRKIDYQTNPVFAIVFARTEKLEEIEDILKIDMKEFIELEKR